MRRATRWATPFMVFLVSGAASAQPQNLPPRYVDPVRPPFASQPQSPESLLRDRVFRDIQTLIRMGKYEDALSRITVLKQQGAAGPDIVTVQGICLRGLGRLDEARKLYRSEADAMSARGEDPSPMLIELERTYREGKDPEGAFAICLEIHRAGGGSAYWVRDEMESLIQADSLGTRVLPALKKEIDRRPDAADLRDLLVGALLFLGRSDEALREARALDVSRGAHGRVLLEHLRLLDRRNAGQPAIDAADAAVSEGLKGDERQEALLLRAAALRRMKRLPEAAEGYERAAADDPDGPLARVALRDRADLLVHEMGNTVEGAKAYEELIASLQKAQPQERGRLLGQARVALAECRLRMGQYEDAAAALRRVEEEAPDAATKEEAAFQQAEILFYSGRPDTAEAAYDRVVHDFAGGARVNDSLDRILMLTRCADAGAVPRAALGQIEYEKRIGSPARALEICQTASKACGSCAAAEDLLREEGLLLVSLGRIDEAAVRADTLASRFGDGGMAPEVLRAVADAMRLRDGDTDAVLRRYEDILARFPKCHEAFEIRALLEKTRRTGTLAPETPREEKRG